MGRGRRRDKSGYCGAAPGVFRYGVAVIGVGRWRLALRQRVGIYTTPCRKLHSAIRRRSGAWLATCGCRLGVNTEAILRQGSDGTDDFLRESAGWVTSLQNGQGSCVGGRVVVASRRSGRRSTGSIKSSMTTKISRNRRIRSVVSRSYYCGKLRSGSPTGVAAKTVRLEGHLGPPRGSTCCGCPRRRAYPRAGTSCRR